MSNKKVDLGTVTGLIIFILIMALAVTFVYYNFVIRASINNTNNEKNVTLDINSELVKKLYGYILKLNYYDETLVYQSNKVTYSNIDNQLKLLTAFENLDESRAEKVKTTDFTGVVEEDGNSYKYLYKKEIVEEKVKEIFGEDATVIHESCPPYAGYNRDYENGIYACYPYAGGGSVPWSNSINQLIKAETDGNNIYIYDTYIHMVQIENIINGVHYSGTYDIYATSDRKILIAEKLDLEKEGVYEGVDGEMPFDEFRETYMKNLSNILENREKTFKHTYTINSHGNYNWVSTEIVD